ncbi:hypothetical protein ACFPZL_06860 [Leucobacter soli]|uniref:Uncharacterized protein n=1 Tax=Leucobacter soli TaxID=2812850 RepID=A0A916JVN2_9MICO|nr:hypothetical protein [Leucobacter soli]CAG7608123.1 hypothetical protein LEUCIP111803_01084 [Leucobacter soli]
MAAQVSSAEEARALIEEPHLRDLVDQLEQPEHQGIQLEKRDYVLLGLATILVPVILTVWGMLAS